MAQIRPTETKLFLKPPTPPQTLHTSIKPITIFANCFGLLPVYGTTSNSVDDLNFKWISLKTLLSFLVLLQAFCASVLRIIFLFKNGVSCTALLGFCSDFERFLLLAAYLYLATKWPTFIKKWHKVDLSMQRVYDYPESLKPRFKIVGAVAVFIAVSYIVIDCTTTNHVLSTASYIISGTISGQYLNVQIFNVFMQVNFILSVVCWAFNDTFVILISTALALRFKQVTDRVLNYGSNMQSLEFWSEIRTDYIRLFELCQLINKHLSFQITLSFAFNTCYFLLDLFFIIKYSNTVQNDDIVIFFVDGLWCVFTITCITVYTAWVNDESKRFADALNAIPSKNYNLAIKLLVEQIPFNPVALSGSNIFQCTRGLILNIVGAVITYELLFIQFSDAIISR